VEGISTWFFTENLYWAKALLVAVARNRWLKPTVIKAKAVLAEANGN